MLSFRWGTAAVQRVAKQSTIVKLPNTSSFWRCWVALFLAFDDIGLRPVVGLSWPALNELKAYDWALQASSTSDGTAEIAASGFTLLSIGQLSY